MVDTDSGSLTGSKAVVLSINNVNEAPTVTSGATANVNENLPASTVVYTATASDPDAGDTKTWSLTGTDASLLSINASDDERVDPLRGELRKGVVEIAFAARLHGNH